MMAAHACPDAGIVGGQPRAAAPTRTKMTNTRAAVTTSSKTFGPD